MSESLDFLALPGIITTKVTETPETVEVECETVDARFPWCCLVRDLQMPASYGPLLYGSSMPATPRPQHRFGKAPA